MQLVIRHIMLAHQRPVVSGGAQALKPVGANAAWIPWHRGAQWTALKKTFLQLPNHLRTI